MLIHPWDAPQDDAEWQRWLDGRDFGQLVVNGAPGEPPHVQPLHIVYVADEGPRGVVRTHLARSNPIWPAIESRPEVVVSIVDDYAYIPGPWQAAPGTPPKHGVPTSFYAAVQLHCTAHLVDDPAEKADLLNRQVAHFQPDGGTAPAAPGEPPFARQLAGIRGLRLEVTNVRAKFKYAGHRPQEHRDRIATGLTQRATPLDLAAHAHLRRRGSTTSVADA